MPWCSTATRCNDMQHVATRCSRRKRCFCNATQRLSIETLHVANRSVLQKTFVTPRGCPAKPAAQVYIALVCVCCVSRERGDVHVHPTRNFFRADFCAQANTDRIAVCTPRPLWSHIRNGAKTTPQTIQRRGAHAG